VDTGRTTPIGGLDLRGSLVVSVLAVGEDAIVSLDRVQPRRKIPRADIYALRRGATRANRLATGWDVASSADGSAIWLKRYDAVDSCTLVELSLDGSERHGVRSIPCSARLVDAGAGAVLIDGESVLDATTGKTLLQAKYLWAMGNDFAVTLEGFQDGLTVVDLESGERRQLRYPSRIGGQGGRDEAAVERKRQLVALSFSDPAYQGSGTQVTDVWLLDPATRRNHQLPDMPAAVSLKRTSMLWTNDGRLVILAETDRRNVVALWRPGQKRLRVRPVALPVRYAGSDAFVVWNAASG
jgi:hypothetical protein